MFGRKHLQAFNLDEQPSQNSQLGPDLTRKNHYGGDALGTVVHGSEFAPKRPEADHVACARLLLEAGSVLDPRYISGCGNPEMVAFLEDWMQSHG